MTDLERQRRGFIRAENEHLGRFLDGGEGGGPLVGWSRAYRCACGFKTGSPGDIFDHALSCTTDSATPASDGETSPSIPA